MSFADLILTMVGFAFPCLLVELAMSKWSPIPTPFHAEMNFVCLTILLSLIFLGASVGDVSSTSGLKGAAATGVFMAFAFGLAIRRCRKRETRISGGFFFLVVGFTLFHFAKGLPGW